jgi:pteridine reductase
MTSQRPVALITGAAKRIGAAIADGLHAAGYDIALHYRESADAAASTQNRLEARRSNSTVLLRAELADTARLPQLVERVITRFGRLDALVNNASGFFPTPIGGTSEAMWDALFASNAKAPFFLAQACAPHLRETRGAIVNLVDIYAERPLEGHTIYFMAKASLQMLTYSLARELGPEVRVNGIAPGAILWPDTGKAYTDQDALIASTALKRIGAPHNIADAVLFLLREAGYTTGQILRVDGGRSVVM